MPCNCAACLYLSAQFPAPPQHCDMCFPKFSIVEEDEHDASYTNARITSGRPSTTRGRSYLPRNSLRSIRSFKNRHSHGSFSDALYYDHHLGEFRAHSHGHPHYGSGGDNKTIIVDNGKNSGNGTTAVEISEDKSGTMTKVISANGKKGSHSLRKSVSWNKAYTKTISDSDSDSSSDSSSSGSSTSSSDSDDDRRYRGRGHSRSGSRSRSHSRSSRSRSRSKSRSRSRSRSNTRYHPYMYNPSYPHPGSEYPVPYHQQRVVSVPTPVAVPVPMSTPYQQAVNPFIQPARPMTPGLIGAQPPPVVIQQAPQLITQDPMHGVHGQYYPGPRAVPIVPQPMGMGMHHPALEYEEDLG